MKRIFGCLLSLLLLLSIAACSTQGIRVPEYDPTVEEYSDSLMFSGMEYTSFEDVCMNCSAIIKAVYLGESEPYDGMRNIFKFKVEEDFTGLADEEIIHLYDPVRSVFVPGKTYYLFMQGMRRALSPHIIYTRIAGVMIGEVPAKYSETGESYYTGLPDEWVSVEDLSAYIRSEIIDKQQYYVNDPQYIHESFEDAYRNADVVILATVKRTETNTNPDNITCYVEILEELKGAYYHPEVNFDEWSDEDLKGMGWTRGVQPEEDIRTIAWEDTKVGDQLILLYKKIPGETFLDIYSIENSIFRADSPEGKWIIETAHAEKAR